MLIGQARKGIDGKTLRNEFSALTVPPVIGPLLVIEDRAACWAKELGRFVIPSVVHMIHHSIILLRCLRVVSRWLVA